MTTTPSTTVHAPRSTSVFVAFQLGVEEARWPERHVDLMENRSSTLLRGRTVFGRRDDAAARGRTGSLHGSDRLGASGRHRAGTSRQPGAARTIAGRVISGGRTPEAHPPAGDRARVRARVLPAHDRAVPAAGARGVRALRQALRQQTGVEDRVLGSRHREPAQIRHLSNRPPTHAISSGPPPEPESARQDADPGRSPSRNDTTVDRRRS
jgi:hypothetical protein